ncbi:MAG: DNA polymerase I [Candidatus Dadabacteria bacterium]|nr:DNA polymerase I [Candidatus Dadabacteria bacterium]
MEERVLYLIDGSSYVFRAYYNTPRQMRTREKFPTNAIYGFTQMLLMFLRQYEPKYIGVVFDSKGKTFRSDIYPEYKAKRQETPEDLVRQFPRIVELVEGFGIPSVQMEGFEADDIMGTISKRVEEEGAKVVLVTGDKDFLQLVSDKVTLLDTMKYIETDVEGVEAKVGVTPAQVVDFLALMGDTSDNVPGVKGIGKKTAAELVKKWGSLEKIIENLEKLADKHKELVEAGIEDANLSKVLVTIKTDVPVEHKLEDFSYRGFDKEVLREAFEKYEMRTLLKELGGDTEAGEAAPPEQDSPVSYEGYRLVLTEKDLLAVVERIREEGVVSIDLETTSPQPMLAEIVGIALAPAPGEAYYVPTGHTSMEAHAQGQLPLDTVLGVLKPVIEDGGIKKIGQNLKYEIMVLNLQGAFMSGVYCDMMVAAHLIDSGRLSYSLDSLSKDYLGHSTITYKDVTGTGKNKIGFGEVELQAALQYAGEDADVALRLAERLMGQLEQEGLLESYTAYELKFIEVLAGMEMRGVKVDGDKLGELSVEFSAELERVVGEVYTEAGREFNINSTLQLRKVLFEELELPIKKRTPKGEPSTDVEVLTDLSRQHPVPAKVLEYRGLAKLKSTYIDALPRLINPETGRIHTSFNHVGTSTGRLSSSDPNLQNIPIKTGEGRRIREAFVPDAGHVLLSADYSQIELRLLAHFSGDEALIEAFRADRDIHSATAAEIFGVSEADVTPEMRRLAKNINFGIIYGISPFGLAKQLGTSMGVAKGYMDEYFARYGRVKSYMESSVEEARSRGYAATMLGRRRPIPELQSKNRTLRGAGERAAINTPVQGTAADIIKIAMIRIHERLRGDGWGSDMILQVHDELLFEVPEGELEETGRMVRGEMESAMELSVPLKVDIGVGGNWAEAH